MGRGPTGVFHDQTVTMGETRLAAEYGITSSWGLGMTIPVRYFKTTIDYVDISSGESVALENPGIHHRNQTLTGIGDLWLMAHWARGFGPWTLDARFGWTLPTGRTEPDPFRLGDMGLAHEHSQFGTGTINPVLGLEVGRGLGPVMLAAYALTQQSIYQNGNGYQAGDRYAGGVMVSTGLGTKKWRFRVGLDAQGETAERWHGEEPTDDGNQGRFDMLAGLGVSWQVMAGLGISAGVKLPLVTEVVGGQLDYPLIGELGLVWSFGGAGKPSEEHGDEHDHEHEHEGEEAGHGHGHGLGHEEEEEVAWAEDWNGADFADAKDVAPVAGKLTVFDFWATWCKPCGELAARMSDLARKHPDAMAVRKLNVTDWKSPLVKRWLTPGKFNLPHVKVFDRDGKLLLERGGEPEDIVAHIERLLADEVSVVPEPVPVPVPDPAPGTVAAPTPTPAKPRKVIVKVSSKGYAPATIVAKPGEELRLVFVRMDDAGCSLELLWPARKKPISLVKGKGVPIRVIAPKKGRITFSCGMKMLYGEVVVK